MPELPEICAYIRTLENLILEEKIENIVSRSPFLIRSFDPPMDQARGKRIESITRLGKRIIWDLESDLHLVFHLMIAGRFKWANSEVIPKTKSELIAFQFQNGTLLLTESGSKKRASLFLVEGEEALADHDPGGLEVLESDFAEFRQALDKENHTLKRSLTDPTLFSGIGNKYSDEILHVAGLSPLKWTVRLSDEEVERLYEAIRTVLLDRLDELGEKAGEESFPSESKKGLKIHGRYREPCPDCGTEIQRIRYSERSTFYCPRCQTGGQLLADRSLSRLLKGDWPKSVEALEERTKS